jgi:hypothetical protein
LLAQQRHTAIYRFRSFPENRVTRWRSSAVGFTLLLALEIVFYHAAFAADVTFWLATRILHPLVSAVSSDWGRLHADRWIVVAIASVLYAAAMVRRGNIWDAFAALAVSNAMLAAWALSGDKWYY